MLLPIELLSRHGATQGEIDAGRATPGVAHVLADLRAMARMRIAAPPPLAVSALKGTGVSVLRDALAALLPGTVPAEENDAPFLAVDRAFSVAGHGTVVTGTLRGGRLAVGQALSVLPDEPWSERTWPDWTQALRELSGRRGRALFLPLRLALTGEDHGPELRDLLPLIGRERAAGRLRMAAS